MGTVQHSSTGCQSARARRGGGRLPLITLEEQILHDPRFADHPDWRARCERALKAADQLLFQRCGDLAGVLWGQFWAAVPDAWLNANTWRDLAARNSALRDYIQGLPAGAIPRVQSMQSVYFNAAPDPAPELRSAPVTNQGEVR